MNFSDLNGIFTTEDLNDIRIKLDSDDEIVVEINFSYYSFKERHLPSNGEVRIFGVGDIIAGVFDGAAVQLTLSYSKGSEVHSRSVTAVPSELRIASTESFDILKNNFLSASNKAIVPIGAKVSLTRCPFSYSILQLNNQPNVSAARDGDAARFDFNIPQVAGVYRAEVGTAKFFFFAVEMANPIQIKFRNLFNALEFLYLDGNVNHINSRSASVAKVGGKSTEFDINSEMQLEVSASSVTAMQMKHVSALAFGHNFEINGVPVTISEIKTDCSDNARELYEVKFTASVSGLYVNNSDFSSRLFLQQFKSQFS